jgi:hypothetical protein
MQAEKPSRLFTGTRLHGINGVNREGERDAFKERVDLMLIYER